MKTMNSLLVLALFALASTTPAAAVFEPPELPESCDISPDRTLADLRDGLPPLIETDGVQPPALDPRYNHVCRVVDKALDAVDLDVDPQDLLPEPPRPPSDPTLPDPPALPQPPPTPDVAGKVEQLRDNLQPGPQCQDDGKGKPWQGGSKASCAFSCGVGDVITVTVTGDRSWGDARVIGDAACGSAHAHCDSPAGECSDADGPSTSAGEGTCKGESEELNPSKVVVSCESTGTNALCIPDVICLGGLLWAADAPNSGAAAIELIRWALERSGPGIAMMAEPGAPPIGIECGTSACHWIEPSFRYDDGSWILAA